MVTALEDITRNALQLPPRQRLLLAGFLLEMDDVTSDLGADAAWEQEIQDRIKTVDSGGVTGVSYHEVMGEAARNLAP